MDRYAQVAMLQLAIMNHRLFMFHDEVQARQRRRAKRFWVQPWLSADRRLQFGHYDQLLKPCSCAQFAPGCKFAPGNKFTPECPFVWPVTDNLLFLNKRTREKSTKDGREVLYLDCLHTKRTCYQPSYRAWCLNSKNVWMAGGDRRCPYKFRYRVEE